MVRGLRWVFWIGLIPATSATAAVTVVDDFEDIGRWSVIASDGVRASVSAADGMEGKALKLDFVFESGVGFCVVRRPVAIDLPANYAFAFSIRGEAPANNLEFKLLDPRGENVWWVNRRGFEFPRQWERVAYRARKFRFAWGPSGGKPLERLGFIEFAVAAGSGGKGSVLIDSLTFEDLPPPQPATQPAMVSFSSSSSGPGRNAALNDAGEVNWQSEAADTSPWLQVDLGQWRELGGVVLDWGMPDFATDYEVALGADAKRWEPVATVRGGNGGKDYVSIPDGEARYVRIGVSRTSRGQGVTVRSMRIMRPEFAESPNAMFQTIACEAREGLYPRYFLGRQTPWTVVGVPGDAREALFNTDGALEVDKLGFRIEPFILVGDRLITWADTASSQSLAQGYLPVPSVIWRTDALSLEITAFADGEPGASTLVARYCLRNRTQQRQTGRLALAIRPFQVLPPWQDLNITGGVAALDTIAFDGRKIVVNGRKVVVPWTDPSAFGAATFAQGEIIEHLATGKLPVDRAVTDPAHLASAALMYPFELAPEESCTVALAVPFHGDGTPPGEPSVDERLRRACDAWAQRLNRVRLSLPPSADRMADYPGLAPAMGSLPQDVLHNWVLGLLQAGRLDEAETLLDVRRESGELEEGQWRALTVYLYQLRAQGASRRDYAEAARLAGTGLDKVGADSALLRTYEVYVHNQIVSLVQARRFEEALGAVRAALERVPASTLLGQDRRMLEAELGR